MPSPESRGAGQQPTCYWCHEPKGLEWWRSVARGFRVRLCKACCGIAAKMFESEPVELKPGERFRVP